MSEGSRNSDNADEEMPLLCTAGYDHTIRYVLRLLALVLTFALHLPSSTLPLAPSLLAAWLTSSFL